MAANLATFGGLAGATTIGSCTLLWVTAGVLSIFAEACLGEVYINYVERTETDIENFRSIKLSMWFACISVVANILAMVVQHAYIYFVVGPRRLFTRPNRPIIRWHAVILEATLWTFFITVETILLIEVKFVWHSSVKNAGRPHLKYKKGMYSAVGYISLFVAFLIFALHQCVIEIQNAIPEENRVRSILGVVREMPMTVVTQVDENQMCVICRDVPINGERTRELPCCHNKFHIDCIEKWLIRRPVCPLCKADLA